MVKIFTDDHAARLKSGKPYKPSNGTEGDLFIGVMCFGCARDTEEGCSIVLHMMAGEQRKEWVIGDDGQPTCTGYRDPKSRPSTPRCRETSDMFGA